MLVAVRENEDRTRLLGYDTNRYKLLALAASGAMGGAAGAAYVLLFSYVGSTFAAIEYSILPLLWVLLGGAGTMMGPFIGTSLMFYLVDVSSEFTSATCSWWVSLWCCSFLVPKGILGTIRERPARG